MTTTLNRHEQRKAATHQLLLDAARDVIVEQGYNNVDILDITERANVSKATFYQHFPNLEACARQLMLQGFNALAEQIFNGGRTAPSREEWVLNSLHKMFNWAASNREFLLIMLGGRASTQLNAFGRNYLVDITRRAMAEFGPGGEFVRYTPELRAQIITGILIQLLGWWLENDTGYSASDMARVIHEVLHNALGPLTV